MKVTRIGVCPVQNIPYSVSVDYTESKTFEGIDYAKGDVICKYNNARKTCSRSDCPIWIKAPDKP